MARTLFSIRDHDPANTLYTGILAAVGYGAARRFDKLFEDALAAVKEKEHIRDMFGRYMSEELVDKIMAREISVEGEKRGATVMFIDIRNFTPLAEMTDPRTLITIRNDFFKLSISTITKHGGFIDKFIGDAIMVFFGAPEPDEAHSESAIAYSVELTDALSTMNATNRATPTRPCSCRASPPTSVRWSAWPGPSPTWLGRSIGGASTEDGRLGDAVDEAGPPPCAGPLSSL